MRLLCNRERTSRRPSGWKQMNLALEEPFQLLAPINLYIETERERERSKPLVVLLKILEKVDQNHLKTKSSRKNN